MGRFVVLQRMEIPDYRDPTGPPYLTRWRLLETPWAGVFLHRMTAPDPTEDLHDHPWSFVSLIVRGGYEERTPHGSRTVRWLNRKRTTDAHSIRRLLRTPTWTIVLIGPRRRVWGYVADDGAWTPWTDHPAYNRIVEALNRPEAGG